MADYSFPELLKVSRDIKTIRAVLLAIDEGALDIEALDKELVDSGKFEQVEVHAHVRMLSEAGYLGEHKTKNVSGIPMGLFMLTWEARDLLDNLRDERILDKAIRAVGEKVGSASVGMIAKLAKRIIEDQLPL